ncbi:MAG: tripartite tricarboxylate transporter substrate binding protein [Geminicoccaceae bacterium]|nr:tripartite tricarboxylate transporter substrate binding protein [Geminicoccaceae bacterium]
MLVSRILKASLAAAAITFAGTATPQAAYPEKPIKVIVPTQAGGGMDSVARILQRYFDETGKLGTQMVVVNMPGAGGTIATREIMDSDPDGYTVGFWHEGIITSKAMGVVDYDHTAFDLLGVTGYGILGLGVAGDSPYQTFGELIEAARAKPNEVKVATNVGLPVHFVPLMVEDAAGVEFRYVQTGGGAKRFPSVVAKHTDTAIFGAIEFINWKDANLKPIVFFSEKRLEQFPDVPTAKEEGIDVIANANRIWLAPKGMPEEARAFLVNALREAMADETVQQQFSDLGVVPEFIEPEEIEKQLDWWAATAEPLVAKARQLQQ